MPDSDPVIRRRLWWLDQVRSRLSKARLPKQLSIRILPRRRIPFDRPVWPWRTAGICRFVRECWDCPAVLDGLLSTGTIGLRFRIGFLQKRPCVGLAAHLVAIKSTFAMLRGIEVGWAKQERKGTVRPGDAEAKEA